MILTPSIHYTGVLNPNMRVFDIIMRTEYGTSYNSYAVLGSEKTALIEAAHLSFGDNYLENVQQALNGRSPDYLVLNHCEPDHTGAVARLLSAYPNLTILVSRAGALYMKGILNNPSAPIRVVNDGEEIDLGGKTLKFISAPFLHWPDSMFTYVKEEKALFTCDFLGSHYCEPEVWDTRIHYTDAYFNSVKLYYDCIFGPFPGYVQKGLEKMASLDVDFAFTSHGPILTRAGELQTILDLYRGYCAEKKPIQKQIPVFYCSAYGNTGLLAGAIKEGILSVLPQANVPLYNVIEHDMATLQGLLNQSDAFVLGSPTLNRDALAPMWLLLSGVDAINIPKRPAALFGSYGWSGEAIPALESRLKTLKVNLFEEGFRVVLVPSAEDLSSAFAFGARFAQSL